MTGAPDVAPGARPRGRAALYLPMAAEAALPSRDGGTGRCTHPSLRHPEFP